MVMYLQYPILLFPWSWEDLISYPPGCVGGSPCAIDPVPAWPCLRAQRGGQIWEAVQHIASIWKDEHFIVLFLSLTLTAPNPSAPCCNTMYQPNPKEHLLQLWPGGQEHFIRSIFSSQATAWPVAELCITGPAKRQFLCTLNSGGKKPANSAILFLLLFKGGWEGEGEKKHFHLEMLFQSDVIWTWRIKSSATIDWHELIALKHCSCIRSSPEFLQASFGHQIMYHELLLASQGLFHFIPRRQTLIQSYTTE